LHLLHWNLVYRFVVKNYSSNSLFSGIDLLFCTEIDGRIVPRLRCSCCSKICLYMLYCVYMCFIVEIPKWLVVYSKGAREHDHKLKVGVDFLASSSNCDTSISGMLQKWKVWEETLTNLTNGLTCQRFLLPICCCQSFVRWKIIKFPFIKFLAHLSSGELFWLSIVHLSVCPSVNFYIFDFSRTTGPILTRLGTNHFWGEGIQVCSNEGDSPSPRGDNSERVNKRPRGHIAHQSYIGKYFAYKHIQSYFSLLPLDHLASKFELFFGSVVSSRDFQRSSPLKHM
jgi:hypothetical protein